MRTAARTPAAGPTGERPAAAGPVLGVDAVGITVADAERSRRFYADVLGFATVADVEVGGAALGELQGLAAPRARVVRMRLGDELLELTEYHTPRGRPAPADSRSNDRWFQHVAIVVSDMDRAYARLRAHGVAGISAAPQRLPDWNPNAGGIRAYYFRDPDGHPLELLQFPEGKGAARWHRPTTELFLGVDHTAIGIGDTEASLAFYRDLLGFAAAGASENYGPEQERLNNVPGAHLRITSVRTGAAGPAIEFLHYLAPRGGRPFPADERPNDLVHWQTTLRVGDAERAHDALERAGHTLITPRVVEAPVGARGSARAFLARDPDGHVMQFIEATQ
jgi:catechol 2,3-dioxygenase-like lactoylglutathione lyase family enzyme